MYNDINKLYRSMYPEEICLRVLLDVMMPVTVWPYYLAFNNVTAQQNTVVSLGPEAGTHLFQWGSQQKNKHSTNYGSGIIQ